MVSTHENWIRIFDIPDISKHKTGFTIYKVVSMLYPESCPDAITKVTVWKRYNDFKKLHRDLKVLHRKLNLKNKYPTLPARAIFKRHQQEVNAFIVNVNSPIINSRNKTEWLIKHYSLFSNYFLTLNNVDYSFDEETIKERRQSILEFLEYIGNVSQLFTSTEFVKFLETSHTPAEHLHSNINTIRAELNLPEDPEVCTYLSKSDDEKAFSDTDSITTMSSLSLSVQPDSSEANNHISLHSNLKKLSSSLSISSQGSSKNSDSLSITTMLDNLTLLDGQIYPTPPNTPSSSVTGDFSQYIIDASVHIKLATELENSKKYEEAYAAYEAAVDILLKYGKDDPNYNHRRMVQYKANKYLIRAEKIYNMYLAPEIKNLRLGNEMSEHSTTNRPLFDLYKFKVVKVISSGMLVLHTELQQLFYIKVIHKTMEFLNDNLILPENVPYMVKLHYHYNCENALFLVLEYCSGMKLSDYIKRRAAEDTSPLWKENQILRQIHDMSDDNDSELSFSDLINEYINNRAKNINKTEDAEQKSEGSDESFVKAEHELLPAKDAIVEGSRELESFPQSTCCVDGISSESQCSKAITASEVNRNDIGSSQGKDSDLTNFVDSIEGRVVLPENIIVKWAAQLLLALEKLHVLGVICRDLEMKNLLLDEKNDLVLTYMCNIKDLCDLFSNGINHNLAPEVYSHHQVSTAADWWSYGSILYELLVGIPLSDVHPNGLNSFSHLKIPKYVSAEGKSILKQLLIYEPHNRLGTGLNGVENIKSHPFFNSVSWESLYSMV